MFVAWRADVLLAVCTGLFVCFCFLLVKFVRLGKRLPPGPRFPTVENFNVRAGRDPRAFLEWRKRWGELSCTRLLHLVVVTVNSHKALDSVFVRNGEHSSGRFSVAFRHHDFAFEDGIIGAQGDIWRQRKSLILTAFRRCGFSHYEQPIERELEELVLQISGVKQPFNPLVPINLAVSNVICRLLFGDRIERSEMHRFGAIMARVNDFMGDENFANNVAIQVLGNITMHLPGDPFHAKRQYQNFTELSNFIGEQIERRQSQLKSETNCLLDALLQEMNVPQSKITVRQIRGIMIDLLIAGMETTSTTILWAILLLAKFPAVQQRVYNEIHEVLDDRVPRFADRHKLVYTEAVLHEVQRFASIAPLSIPHVATDTFEVDGFVIPKNAVLIANLYAAHHDEEVWPDPHNFNPLNFFDETKRCFVNREYLVPFAVGRRSCLGEMLALQELFVFFAGLVRSFRFSESTQFPLPDVHESTITATRSPKKFKIDATLRKV